MRKPGKQAVLSSWRLQPAVTVEDQSTQKGKGSGGRAWALAGSDKAQEGNPRHPRVQGPGLAGVVQRGPRPGL